MGRSVRRYTPEGKLDLELALKALAAQADGTTGGAWVVTPEEVLIVSRKGEIEKCIRHERHTSMVWIAGL